MNRLIGRLGKIVQKAWFYFRMGHGQYLTYPLSFISFVVVVFDLALKDIPFFAGIHLWLFSIVFFTPYVLLAVGVGYAHMNIQAFTDSEIGSIKSPYVYRMVPVGKEAKLGTPMGLFSLQCQRRVMEKLGILTLEDKVEFAKYEQMIVTLLKGGEVR